MATPSVLRGLTGDCGRIVQNMAELMHKEPGSQVKGSGLRFFDGGRTSSLPIFLVNEKLFHGLGQGNDILRFSSN